MAPAYSVRKLVNLIDGKDFTSENAGNVSKAAVSMTSFILSWLAWQAFLHKMLADGDETDLAEDACRDSFMLTKTMNVTMAKAELAEFYGTNASLNLAGRTYDNDTQRWRSSSA